MNCSVVLMLRDPVLRAHSDYLSLVRSSNGGGNVGRSTGTFREAVFDEDGYVNTTTSSIAQSKEKGRHWTQNRPNQQRITLDNLPTELRHRNFR